MMVYLALAESIQLVPDGTLFVHIAIILLMIFVLNRMLFKPVDRVLTERERRTLGRSGEAKDILKRVEAGLSNYERSLREARAESYRLLEAEQAKATEARQRKVGQIRKEVKMQVGDEKNGLQSQMEDARANLLNDARQMAASVSQQVLGRPL